MFIAIADAICRWMRGISFVNAKQKPFHVLRHTSLAMFFFVFRFILFFRWKYHVYDYFFAYGARVTRDLVGSFPFPEFQSQNQAEEKTNTQIECASNTHTHSAALQHSAIKIELTTTEYLHIRA